MKKLKMFLIVLLMILFTTKVYAVCNDKDLVDMVSRIKVNFIEDKDIETIEKDENGNDIKAIQPAEYAYLLTFLNFDDIRISVFDPVENETIDAEYNYKYDLLTVGSTIHYTPKKYEISIYSKKKGSCNGELLRKIYYTVPAFNEYSLSDFCKNNPSVKECAINYDSNKLSTDDYLEIEENIEKNNETRTEVIMSNLKKYWYLVFIPIILISIYYGIKIYVYKKKANRI